jgi:hypothetical protein
MNFILGSGINALLAKLIMGNSWQIVPFGRSRFFSFNPALCDNFIIKDDRISEFLKDAFKISSESFDYKCAYSTGGHIYNEYDTNLTDDWLHKIYNGQAPGHLQHYYKSHMKFEVYNLRINKLYTTLLNSMKDEIISNSTLGNITSINDGYFIRNGKKEEYNKIINTIPQNAFMTLCGKTSNLIAKDVSILHIETAKLNFEGYNQLWVTDRMFDFYKVTQVSPNRYVFYCHNDIPQPGPYFMPILGNDFDILDGTSIQHMLPINKVTQFDTDNIKHVGSMAQWDVGMDVGSCIIKLLMLSTWGRN